MWSLTARSVLLSVVTNRAVCSPQLSEQLKTVLVKIPVALQEAVVRLLNRDPRQRPTAQLLSLIKYFRSLSVNYILSS